jgi:hypothetical protein
LPWWIDDVDEEAPAIAAGVERRKDKTQEARSEGMPLAALFLSSNQE